MAEHPEGAEEEVKSTYKPPAEKSMDEILKADEEDESLKKYKEQLLGKQPESCIPCRSLYSFQQFITINI